MSQPADVSSRLCLACGLCCDGTLFADVELRPGDSPAELRESGFPLRRGKDSEGQSVQKFSQPCSALGSDCRCAVYAGRPARCREFDCDLLRAVQAGERTADSALRRIRETRRQRDAVRLGLERLGNREIRDPLSKRFKQVRKAMECGALPEGLEWDEAADHFGELTMAVSALQFTLSRDFYSRPA
jgi:Fe-S-cluster containining protein